MRGRSWLSFMGNCAVLLVASRARAQCTMDTECSGEAVCEEGQCVAPEPAPPVAAPRAAAAPAAAAAPPVAIATPAAAPPVAPPPGAPEPPPQPAMVLHSPGMMAVGIVMMPLAIGALAVAVGNAGHPCDSSVSSQSCDNDSVRDGALFSAVVLIAVGMPLIIIGAKKEPAKPNATATVAPWATLTGAGIGLRISL